MKIIVLGATGMLGNAVMRILSEMENWKVFGTIRSQKSKLLFETKLSENLIVCSDLTNFEDLSKIFNKINPEIIINCTSINKELLNQNDPLLMIPIYSLLPHQLSKLCKANSSRLIQISSDGVFSGAKGNYIEDDPKDAEDIYGLSKFIGEVEGAHALTIRTSIIGHELESQNGLLEWFLQQKNQCECFTNAIFSGLPAVALAQIIRDVIIPKKHLNGIYHIASNPISKCDLLKMIAEVYGLKVKLKNNNNIKINRSLNATKFQQDTGFKMPEWIELIKLMHAYK